MAGVEMPESGSGVGFSSTGTTEGFSCSPRGAGGLSIGRQKGCLGEISLKNKR